MAMEVLQFTSLIPTRSIYFQMLLMMKKKLAVPLLLLSLQGKNQLNILSAPCPFT